MVAVTIFRWGHTGVTFEGMRKGMAVTKPKAQGNGLDASVGIIQFFFCTIHCFFYKVLFECHTGFFME